MPKPGSFDQSVRAALEQSALAPLPARALERLRADAVRLDIPAGAVPYRGGEAARVGLIVTGLARVYLTSSAGRQITIRYARPGELLGIPALVGGPVNSSVQAVTDCAVLMLNARTLMELGTTDASVAWAIAREIARRLADISDVLSGIAFGSIRERTAAHLLALAAPQPHSRRLITPVTQQEIADAVGSVREVIARALLRLQADGLIQSTSAGIAILDPDGLAEVASAKTTVT